MNKALFVLVSAATVAAFAACSSSSSSPTTTGTDSGATTKPATDDSGATQGTDAGTGGGDSGTGAGDSGSSEPAINGCTTYVDHTAGTEVDLTWDFTINSQPDHCSKIKLGTTVKWTGDFTTHPLEALNGDPANPINSAAASGGAATITFPVSGAYGYDCAAHKTAMQGAIIVVP
jgi:plastocyanin